MALVVAAALPANFFAFAGSAPGLMNRFAAWSPLAIISPILSSSGAAEAAEVAASPQTPASVGANQATPKAFNDGPEETPGSKRNREGRAGSVMLRRRLDSRGEWSGTPSPTKVVQGGAALGAPFALDDAPTKGAKVAELGASPARSKEPEAAPEP